MQALIEANRTRRVNIAVVGDVMIDEYIDGTITRVSPEAPVPVITTHGLPDAYPGGAANVAYQFRHWNVDVSLIGFADTPTIGTLQNCFLPTDNLVLAGKTPVKRRFYADGKLVFRQDVELRDCGLDGDNLVAARRRLLDRLDSLLAADAVIFSDYDKGVFSREFISEAIKICRARDIPIVVDHKRRPLAQWEGATVVKMNEHEVRTLYDKTCPVIITLGGRGYWIHDLGEELFPREPVPAANVIGSGDCHVAHLALALAHGREIEFAAEFAYDAGRAYVRGNRNRPNFPHEVLAEADPAAAKLIDVRQLRTVIDTRHAESRIVFANGVFDLLHPGHLHTLRWAAAQGDLLIVGLNSDESVRRLKGNGRPFLSQDRRAAMLAALDCVDYIVMYDQPSAGDVLEALRPNTMVKGPDYNLADVLHQDLVGETLIAPASGFEWHSSDFLQGVAA